MSEANKTVGVFVPPKFEPSVPTKQMNGLARAAANLPATPAGLATKADSTDAKKSSEGFAEVPTKAKNIILPPPRKDAERTIQVVATAKGWFLCRRIFPGMKFKVSEQEFSDAWMERI